MQSVVKIKDRYIGNDYPCYIIAEMSANHAGDLDNAIEIIHAAKEAGADCIKIQTYTADTITMDSNKEYFHINSGTWNGENLYSLYKKAFTPWEWQKRLKDEADKIGIHFFSTPFDRTAVDFLEDIGVEFYKIASFELVDTPLLEYVASKRKPIIMSTGMASLEEIEEAVNTIKTAGNENLCLLKCSSNYPAVPENMNLKTIQHMHEIFDIPVGLSDHTLGSISAITAVSLGARIIEKHFCLSREIDNPDVSFSMPPDEFKKMVADIREAEKAMGKVSYELSEDDLFNRKYRKSIFVTENIKKGDSLSENNIRVIRPANGLSPRNYKSVLGKAVTRDIEKGTPLDWNMIV